VQIQLDASPIHVSEEKPQPIIAMADTTFFGRGYGVIVIRCPRLKKNVHFHEVQSETPEEYHRARFMRKRIRSAFRSLHAHLPFLFTYQRHPHLHIPNTTNSLDGSFGKLKQLLNVHCGLTTQRRYRLIQEILS